MNTIIVIVIVVVVLVVAAVIVVCLLLLLLLLLLFFLPASKIRKGEVENPRRKEGSGLFIGAHSHCP